MLNAMKSTERRRLTTAEVFGAGAEADALDEAVNATALDGAVAAGPSALEASA